METAAGGRPVGARFRFRGVSAPPSSAFVFLSILDDKLCAAAIPVRSYAQGVSGRDALTPTLEPGTAIGAAERLPAC